MNKIQILNLNSFRDKRGILTSFELGKDIDFEVKRIFFLHHILSERGGHAHIDTDQVLICIYGSLDIDIFFENKQYHFNLDNPDVGLTIPRLSFVKMKNFSSNACVLVLANTYYDKSKSLRTFEDYKNFINQSNVH